MSIITPLYASRCELSEADRIALYGPAMLLPDTDRVHDVVIKRDGMSPFVVPEAQVQWLEGKAFIQASSMPGNSSHYRYMLLRELGAYDRVQGAFFLTDDRQQPLVGMTHWDRLAVDQQPGLYYATARNGVGKTALLLGPFDRHIDALVRVDRASALTPQVFGLDCWDLSFGTMRMDADASTAPRGKLNAYLLTGEEQHLLPHHRGEKNNARPLPESIECGL